MIRKTKIHNGPQIHTESPRLSYYKIILSGRIVEAFQYKDPVGYNLHSDRKKSLYRQRRPLKEQETTKSSLSRTKNRLLRLINANAFMWELEGKSIEPVFVTFTFADNVIDLDVANSIFTNYIKRLNYQIFKSIKAVAKYVVVPEFQKRGAVHYHAVFFNLPKVDFRKEFKDGRHQGIWGQGFITVKPVHEIFNTGLYMAKYLGKDLKDRRLVGRKKFFSSRGLHQPEVITKEHIAEEIMDYLSTLKSSYAYITRQSKDSPLPIDNPTWHATYSLLKNQYEKVLTLAQKSS